MRILYIANYAPIPGADRVSAETADNYHQLYHQEIYDVLSSLGFDVHATRTYDDLLTRRSDADYVFSLLNRSGHRGSEMLVSSVCENEGVPYLGAPPDIRAIADDKFVSKLVASHLDIPVPRGHLIRVDSETPMDPPFPGPFFVKARSGAASLFVDEHSVQSDWSGALERAQIIHNESEDVLIEQFIPGDDVSIAVLGGMELTVLPASRVQSPSLHGIVTRTQKQAVITDFKRSALDDQELHRLLQRWSASLFRFTQPMDYARYDFRVPTDGTQPKFLEFNVCCSIGSDTGFAASAEEVGISHRELVARILRWSFRRQGLKHDCF